MAELLDLNMILAAFGGGLFGAAIGALPSFIFCGFLVLAGEAITVAGGPAIANAAGFTGAVGFGTLFGPHIGFAGGAAASAYAAHVKDSLEDGADILTPLLKIGADDTVWDILVVGGIFGIIGYFLNGAFSVWQLPTDTIALTVGVSALIHRVLFCNTGIFGTYDPEKSDSRWDPPASIAWLPFQMKASHLITLGLGMGLVSGYVTLATGSIFIMFGIAAASLIILETKGSGPVTHHIALPASAAAAATGSILMGGLYGILGAVIGEFYARLFYDWGDSHIDPPAWTIATLIFATIMLHGFNWSVPTEHLLALF